jgi:hypothetical protein
MTVFAVAASPTAPIALTSVAGVSLSTWTVSVPASFS